MDTGELPAPKHRTTATSPASVTSTVLGLGGNFAYQITKPILQFTIDWVFPAIGILSQPFFQLAKGLGNLALYTVLGLYAIPKALIETRDKELPIIQSIRAFRKSIAEYVQSTRAYKSWQHAQHYLSPAKAVKSFGNFLENSMGSVFKNSRRMNPWVALGVMVLLITVAAPLTSAFGAGAHIGSFWFLKFLPAPLVQAGMSMWHGLVAALPAMASVKAVGAALWHTPLDLIANTATSIATYAVQQALSFGTTSAAAFTAFKAAPLATISNGISAAWHALPSAFDAGYAVGMAIKAIPPLLAFGLTNVVASVAPKIKLLLPVVVSACWQQAKKTLPGRALSHWYNYVTRLDAFKDVGSQRRSVMGVINKYVLLGTGAALGAWAVGPLSLPALGLGAIFAFNAVKEGVPAIARAVGLEKYVPSLSRKNTTTDKIASAAKHFIQEFNPRYWEKRLNLPAEPVITSPVKVDAPEITQHKEYDQQSNDRALRNGLLAYGGSAALSLATVLASKEILLGVGKEIAHSAFGAAFPGAHEVAYYASFLLATATAGLATTAGTSILHKASSKLFKFVSGEVTTSRKYENAEGRLMLDGAFVGATVAVLSFFGAPVALTLGAGVVLNMAFPSIRKGFQELSEEYHRTAKRPATKTPGNPPRGSMPVLAT